MKIEVVTPEEAGLSAQRLERIKPAMQAYVDQKKIAGVSTMVARRGKVVHFEQVGQMDLESNTPMPADAIFRIYSMTKPTVCAALMTLYEQGCFQLFDPIAKFIPAFSNLKVLESDTAGEIKEVDLARPITIRDLLTHTAGLTYDFFEDSPVSELYRQARLINNVERTLEELTHELARLPLAYQPGSRWHYSLAIDVVAHLIEVISGQSLDHFLKEKIFSPLGMIDTDFYLPSAKRDRLVTMYGRPDIAAPDMTLSKLMKAWESGFNERIDLSETHPASKPVIRGGSGLFSTAWDYMRFAQMLLNQGELDGVRILGRKIVELMYMNHLPADLLPFEFGGEPNLGYGFGLGSRVLMNVAESQMPGSVGEFGGSGIATTYYWVDPEEKIVGILMAQNMVGWDTPEMAFRVLAYQALVD